MTRRLIQHHNWKMFGNPRREHVLEDQPQTKAKICMRAISQLYTYRKSPLLP